MFLIIHPIVRNNIPQYCWCTWKLSSAVSICSFLFWLLDINDLFALYISIISQIYGAHSLYKYKAKHYPHIGSKWRSYEVHDFWPQFRRGKLCHFGARTGRFSHRSRRVHECVPISVHIDTNCSQRVCAIRTVSFRLWHAIITNSWLCWMKCCVVPKLKRSGRKLLPIQPQMELPQLSGGLWKVSTSP